jgi:hypothetical protein
MAAAIVREGRQYAFASPFGSWIGVSLISVHTLRRYARSPNLRRALRKMLDEQGSRPALPRRRLKSNLRRASHAS